ncbi:hypothetical protein ACQ5SI_02350 [Peribacillus frigoritolerans]|uniref:hypothetical protein n=1 Tax=Peribacillus frigoritolerans TaxID=450367 RepID=UPI003D3522F7
MDIKSVRKIDNVCKLDTEVKPILLLKFHETITWLFERFDDISELEDLVETMGIFKNGYGGYASFSKELLKFIGLEEDDEIAEDYIDAFCTSEEKDITLLKKQLIEHLVELDN